MNSGHRGKVKIVAVGDELGFAFPQDIMERHQLRQGDTIGLSWDGSGLLLTLRPTDDPSVPPQDANSQK